MTETTVQEDESQHSHFSATLNNDGTTTIQDLTPDSGNDDALRFSALAAVQHALSQEPLDFENEIKRGLADRVQTEVEKRREEVAKSIFGVEDPEEDSSDNDADDDNSEE